MVAKSGSEYELPQLCAAHQADFRNPRGVDRFIDLGLTQLEDRWGCLGERSPPKHPQNPPQLRNF